MDESRRSSLLRLIINAGLEEELVAWLERRGYVDLYGKLDNVPIDLIEEFVNEMKLLCEGDVDRELLRESESVDYYEEKRGAPRSRRPSYT